MVAVLGQAMAAAVVLVDLEQGQACLSVLVLATQSLLVLVATEAVILE